MPTRQVQPERQRRCRIGLTHMPHKSISRPTRYSWKLTACQVQPRSPWSMPIFRRLLLSILILFVVLLLCSGSRKQELDTVAGTRNIYGISASDLLTPGSIDQSTWAVEETRLFSPKCFKLVSPHPGRRPELVRCLVTE